MLLFGFQGYSASMYCQPNSGGRVFSQSHSKVPQTKQELHSCRAWIPVPENAPSSDVFLVKIIIIEISFIKVLLVYLTCDFDFLSLLFINFYFSRETQKITNVKGLHKVKCLVHDEVTNTACMLMCKITLEY